MSKNPVGWFEIPVNNMDRAKTFYSSLFNFDFQDMQMPGMEMLAFPFNPEEENISGALVKVDGISPSGNGTRVYFTCENLDLVSKVEGLGGKISIPVMDIGEHGKYAAIEDTEGNVIGLHSHG